MSIETAQGPLSIRIFVPNGDPAACDLSKSPTGPVFRRSNTRAALSRSEIGRTGVFILVGSFDDKALRIIHVGEGVPVDTCEIFGSGWFIANACYFLRACFANAR